MKRVLSQRNDIAFYIKLFPLKKIHPDSYRKSKAIVCARLKSNQKAKELLDKAYDKKPIKGPTCNTSWLDKNIKLADRLGITGTPTMVFPNGKVISGARQASELIRLIEQNQK